MLAAIARGLVELPSRIETTGVVETVATYKIRLVNPSLALDTTIDVADDEFILDAAAAQAIDLPASCHAGSCFSCAARVKAGHVDQDNPDFLDPEEIDAGYILTCVTRPTSDCTIETHKENELE